MTGGPNTYQSFLLYVLQQWDMFSSQTANGMQRTILNQRYNIQVFQLFSIPLHVWNEDESSFHVRVLEYDSLNFTFLIQYIVHPLQQNEHCTKLSLHFTALNCSITGCAVAPALC